MYEIVLFTWYANVGSKEEEEIYGTYESLEDACEVFANKYKDIIEYFPVDKILIRFKKP